MKNTETFLTHIQQYITSEMEEGWVLSAKELYATKEVCVYVYAMTHSPDLTVLRVKMKMHQTRFLGSLLSHCFVSCVSCAHITNSSAAGDVAYVGVCFLS